MRVLVTGASGFIGGYIADYLAKEGIGVVRNTRGQCDLLNAAALPGPFDAVVHCAAAAGPWCTPEQIERDNIQATKALVLAATKWRAKFIFCSSISVYGQVPVSVSVLDEESPSGPLDEYGASKFYGERLLRFVREMPSIALRLPGVIGPNCHGRNWLPRVAQNLKATGRVQAFNLDSAFNNAVHVADLAKFITQLLNRRWAGFDAIVLSAAGGVTVRQAIERLGAGLGIEPIIEAIPAPKPSFVLSCARAAMKWGYDPMEIGAMIDRYAEEIR